MKANIHPKWYPNAKVVCSCGTTFEIGSTMEEIRVEICSACHPFFTGQMKYVDTAGRVEKFQKRQQSVTGQHIKKKDKKAFKRLQTEKEESIRPKSLKEMLHQGKQGEQEKQEN